MNHEHIFKMDPGQSFYDMGKDFYDLCISPEELENLPFEDQYSIYSEYYNQKYNPVYSKWAEQTYESSSEEEEDETCAYEEETYRIGKRYKFIEEE